MSSNRMGGNQKRQRKPRTTKGLRKIRAAKKGNLARRGAAWLDLAAIRCLKDQALNLWPSVEDCDKYARANMAPLHRRPDKPIKPSRAGFSLFDMAIHTEPHRNIDLAHVFMCASMSVKKLNRAPWYRVVKTHALGNRVLNLEV